MRRVISFQIFAVLVITSPQYLGASKLTLVDVPDSHRLKHLAFFPNRSVTLAWLIAMLPQSNTL
jgi:hypothetical protein